MIHKGCQTDTIELPTNQALYIAPHMRDPDSPPFYEENKIITFKDVIEELYSNPERLRIQNLNIKDWATFNASNVTKEQLMDHLKPEV